MEQPTCDLNTFRFDGGILCLDFVNTVRYLQSYADLLGWSQLARAITPEEGGQLHRFITIYPTKSATAFDEAVTFRESFQQVLLHFINGQPIPNAELAACNAVFTQMWANLDLCPTESQFAWSWRDDAVGLRYPLWKIAHSAATLLASDDATRIKTCERCSWFFLDTSRNRSRRWCSMEICGNRTKAARHYRKSQE